MFIVLEGIDGCGKSIIAKLFRQKFQPENINALILKDPTKDRKYGIQIRNILSQEKTLSKKISAQLLKYFKKDRLYDIEKRISPSLISGKTVILDRYYLSTSAYQSRNIQEAEDILQDYLLNKKILAPDILFYDDLPAEDALKRIQARGESNELFDKLNLLKEIYKRYEYILKALPYKYFRLNGRKKRNEIANEACEIIHNENSHH